jgi:hypothetical protein
MLRVLGYSAIPSWPLGAAAAWWWSGRAELLLLSVASVGTSSALALMVMRQADARAARRAAEYERLEGRLCGVIADDLRPRGHRPARTLPDLRIVR